MSGALKTLYDKLVNLNSDAYPDFVVNNEIKGKGIGIGDYIPKIDHIWGDEHYRFEFKKRVIWDYSKSDELYSMVEVNPKYHVLRPKTISWAEKIILKHKPVTREMLYNHHLIFDKSGYEYGGITTIRELMTKKDYKPFSYYDSISGEKIETREDAESMIPDRIAAMVNSTSIVTSLDFLDTSADLLEEIGRFFNAKT